MVDNKEAAVTADNNPYSYLRSVLSQYNTPKIPEMPPFIGGFVGYFSYEMIGYTEPVLNLQQSEFADFDMMLFDKVVAYDHLKQKISLIANISTDKLQENYDKAITDLKELEELITEQNFFFRKPAKVKPNSSVI